MSDAVFENAGAVRREGESLEVVGATAGPAGAAALELLDGSLLQVDYADPAVLVDYSLAASDAATSRALREIVGRDTAAEVAAFVEQNIDSVQRLTPLRRRQGPWSLPDRSMPFDDDTARLVGEGLRLTDQMDDPNLPLVERAVAGLDAVTAVPRVRYLSSTVGEAMAEATDRLGDLLDACGDELLDLAADHRQIREHLSSIADALPYDFAQRLRAIGRTSRRWTSSDAADLDFIAADMSPTSAAQPPAQPSDAAPGVWIVPCDAPVDSEPRWARVVDADLTVLAVAPVLESEGGYAAELLVPDDLDRSACSVLITAEPFPAAVSPLDAVARAVRAGRRAVDLEARGKASQAAEQWLACAELWDELGDSGRAGMARRYAEGRHRSPRRVIEPALADLVAALVS